MYTVINFATKKALKAAVKAGRPEVGVYQPGPFYGHEPTDGPVTLEGPHYPEPHRWYASGVLKDGVLISVR